MRNLNIGILGPGRVAHRFAVACKNLENINLWSICARDISKAKSFAENHHVVAPISVYDDVDVFLSDPNLHAVIIATPDINHTQYAIKAAEKGKHLLIEKPICTEIEEAKAIVNIVKATRVVCSIGYHLRWHAGLRKLASNLHENKYGEIYHMDIHWAHAFIDEAKWRKSHATSKWWSLTTLGTHSLDIARWYLVPLCGEVIESKVITTNTHYHQTDEASLISLKFASGTTASIYSSILFSSSLNFNIYTQNGLITGKELTGPFTERSISVNNEKLEFTCESNLYEKEIYDLYTSILQSRSPEVTAQAGLYNIMCMTGY